MAEYVVNSGKLCILDLLKGSINFEHVIIQRVVSLFFFFFGEILTNYTQ